MKSNGFTLTELIVTMAIVGILAAIAYPTYQSHVQKVRRADATGGLTELAQWLERNYTENMSYNLDGQNNAIVLPFTKTPKESATAFYLLSVTFPVAAPNRAGTFTLRATPQGPQVADTNCGVLELRSNGVKCILNGAFCSDNPASQPQVAKCW